VRRLSAIALVLLMTACAPSSASPSPSATTTFTVTVRPTATPSSPPPASAAPTPITLPSIATISATSGDFVWALVAGTRLFRSSDRGATWEERGVPPSIPIGDIAFINALQGWLSSPGPPATQCQSQSVGIYQTSDAGATWPRIYQSDAASDTLCKGALYFVDVQRGFLTLTSPSSNSAIQRMTDGGRTWTRSQPLPDPPGFTSAAGVALTAGRAWSFGTTVFVGALGGGSGIGKAYGFRSTDGGATWTYLTTAPRPDVQIAFVTATRWLQIGPPGQSSETTDAGATWHAFTTDYQQAAPINPQIVFGDANVGYATVRGAIQRTVDGGAHWTTIKTPGT
jgi:photosystem II stability/assembly factor-like uncharacterized protein